MKLLIQSDDLGITQAVTCGIIRAIEEGVLTCTGLFANMPASEHAAKLIQQYPHICVGQDINIVAGAPCADPKQIPSLVDEQGSFLTSGRHRVLDQTAENHDHLNLEECLIETEAQIQRFIELMGKKPEYLHGHSYGTPTLRLAMKQMADKYGIRLTTEIAQRHGLKRLKKDWNKKPFSFQEQLEADPLSCIMNSDFKDNEMGMLVFHCGYVDKELFDVSTYTLVRTRDLDAVISPRLKAWIKDNGIELISYRDLVQ